MRRHRVLWTDPHQPTIWLAIDYCRAGTVGVSGGRAVPIHPGHAHAKLPPLVLRCASLIRATPNYRFEAAYNSSIARPHSSSTRDSDFASVARRSSGSVLELRT